MVGGRPKKRLSRTEFEEMVRNMGARAAREYMLNVGTPRDSRELNVIDQIEPTEGMKAVELRRLTGMKKGGIVKAGKVAKFKNGGCVMAGRGVRNTKVL